MTSINFDDFLNKPLTKEKLESYKDAFSPFQKLQIARHQLRPKALDYINGVFSNFIELHGDRMSADDQAILTGLAYIDDIPVIIIAQEKGKDTESRIKHNFGAPKPEGYRKVLRMMKMAHRFNLPVISLVDTSGASAGKDAEEHNISESIANCMLFSFKMKAPFISIIIGEGGSGGAIATATADVVYMLEHSVYSVIAPEACSIILWKDNNKAEEAAKALKITAQDLKKMKVIDCIIPEPVGGAHRDHIGTMIVVKKAVLKSIKTLQKKTVYSLVRDRRNKFRKITTNF